MLDKPVDDQEALVKDIQRVTGEKLAAFKVCKAWNGDGGASEVHAVSACPQQRVGTDHIFAIFIMTKESATTPIAGRSDRVGPPQSLHNIAPLPRSLNSVRNEVPFLTSV